MWRCVVPVSTAAWHFASSPRGFGICVARIASKTSEFSCQLYGFHRRQFSSITPSLTKGEECYQKALEALKQADKQKHEKEEQKSLQQYEAWERSQHRNPVSGGVAVIKTIAKQTRRDKKEEEQKHSKWTDQAQLLLQEAAFQHKHPKSLVILGNDALEKAKKEKNQDLVQEKVREALEYFRMAGELDSADGWFNLGQLLWTGYPDQDRSEPSGDDIVLRQDKIEARNSFVKAMELGDRDAMYLVGVNDLSDEQGDCESLDSAKSRLQAGLNFIEMAADSGHPGALYYLALFHYNGNTTLNITACSSAEFCKRLDAAADAGDPDALFLRGHGLFHGEDGRDKDYQKALRDFIQAAEAKHADAAVSAGAMLHQGTGGVVQDQRAAFELYQIAAELGSLDGWRNVVACYALGEGVPQCQQTAEYIKKTMLQDDDQIPSSR